VIKVLVKELVERGRVYVFFVSLSLRA